MELRGRLADLNGVKQKFPPTRGRNPAIAFLWFRRLAVSFQLAAFL
jgi:hypothetical protein